MEQYCYMLEKSTGPYLQIEQFFEAGLWVVDGCP